MNKQNLSAPEPDTLIWISLSIQVLFFSFLICIVTRTVFSSHGQGPQFGHLCGYVPCCQSG
jgi:hypothetical protein